MPVSEFERSATQWPDSFSELPTQPVGRLIYASLSQVAGPVLDEMRRIRDHALVHNGSDGIRVALLHMCGWFVEWMEGPPEALERLVQRLAQDTRHHSLKVIHRSEGRARLLRPWIGSVVQTRESSSSFAQRVLFLKNQQARGIEMEPASVWLALCSPLPEHVEPGRHHRDYPRVMLVAARGTRSFDLLNWLYQENGGELVRRRFAGSTEDALDVASDYLDLPNLKPHGMRLIANARKGVAMGMMHAFLPDYGAVVVLLDADPARNERIVNRLVHACHQVHRAPVLIGLGPAAWMSSSLKDQVERQGLPWRDAPIPLDFHAVQLSDYWAALQPNLHSLD